MSGLPKLTPVKPDGSLRLARRGLRTTLGGDLYHFVHQARWRVVLSLVAALYLAANAIFASFYLALGAEITTESPSFWDYFFFSVQSMSTIGYGTLAPANVAANVLVVAEAIFGVLFTAITTGLVFSRFATPRARIVFSRTAVIHDYEGVPTLVFRMANERGNQFMEAHVALTLTRDEVSPEGMQMRRIYDLMPLRQTTPLFALTWTVLHPIDEHSPLYGQTPESLNESSAAILVTVAGTDSTIMQTVHARHGYGTDAIRFGEQFVDIIEFGPGGQRLLHLDRLHHTVEAPS